MASGTFHTVNGVKVYGLIIDPGAAHALMGVDTLLHFLRGTGVTPIFCRSDRAFVGIDGEPSPGLKKVSFPLGTPGLNAEFETDLIGGGGSLCPGLLPLFTMREHKCVLLCGFFSNDDGLFIVTVDMSWLGERVFLTDSGHYALPCDDYSQKQTE